MKVLLGEIYFNPAFLMKLFRTESLVIVTKLLQFFLWSIIFLKCLQVCSNDLSILYCFELGRRNFTLVWIFLLTPYNSNSVACCCISKWTAKWILLCFSICWLVLWITGFYWSLYLMFIMDDSSSKLLSEDLNIKLIFTPVYLHNICITLRMNLYTPYFLITSVCLFYSQ